MRGTTRSRLLQLPVELVQHILLLLAMSSNGAMDIARILLVSKRLKRLAMSADILRALSFGKEPLPANEESFWNKKGLIIKSARARNKKTYREITKCIKEKIDSAYTRVDFALPDLEKCHAKVTAGTVSASLMTAEIRTVLMNVRRYMVRIILDLQRADLMINALGRRYFRTQKLLVRQYYIKEKYGKCATIQRFLKEKCVDDQKPDDSIKN